MAESEKYRVETDLSRRVRDWEAKIKPILEDEVSCLVEPMLCEV
jgi:hypothetical protein